MRFKSLVACLLALCLCVGALPALMNTAQAAMPYYITVDVTNQIVTVYENGNRTRNGVVRQMICSTGAPGHSTPLGTFTLPPKSRRSERTEWYSFPAYNCYAKWATRIKGPFLFHSIIYNRRGGSPTRTSLNALGRRASHGCVRLRPDDAKWIALNCAAGTQVRIYYSGKYDSGLRKRLLKHSFYRGNESYYSFLGLNTKIPLKKNSGGTLVKKLQKRLRALGYFTGSIGGNFLDLTDAAVRAFQKDAGLKQNGVVTQAVWDRIFASSAPTGTRVSLAKGSKGPVVATLQRELQAVKCYSGEINGSYDDATVKAVRKWQKVRGYKITGKATPVGQRKLLTLVVRLQNKFGSEPYKLVSVKTAIHTAKITATKAVVYEKASGTSAKLLTLKKGAEVQVVAAGEGWLKVTSGNVTGYIKASTASRTDTVKTSYRYQLASQPAPQAPGELPGIELPVSNGLSIGEDLGWAVTGSEGVAALSAADGDAPVLAEVPANTVLCVLEREDGFIRVSWQGQSSYVALADVTLVADGDPMPVPEAAEPEPELQEDPEAGLTLDEAEAEPVEAPQAAEVVPDGEIAEAEAPETGAEVEAAVVQEDEAPAEGAEVEAAVDAVAEAAEDETAVEAEAAQD